MNDDFRSIVAAERTRARWTTYLLYACIATDVIAIASGLAQRTLLSRLAAGEELSPGEADANDARHGAIGTVQTLAFIIAAVIWLVWLHRAYSNLGAIGTRKSRFTSGWAVGYWFVPFINLVRPYQIVVDLWLRSDSLNSQDSALDLARPSIISWWWGVYLLFGLGGRLVVSYAQSAQSLSQLLQMTDIDMSVDAIGIVAALLAIAVVRGIDQRQQWFLETPGTVVAG